MVDLALAAGLVGRTAADVADDAFASDRAMLSRTIAEVVRAALAELDARDRLIFRLRFEGGLSIAEISRTLRLDQKPLYRRMQRALVLIRQRLESAGVTSEEAMEIACNRRSELDFGLDMPEEGQGPLGADDEELP
jgi:DNA-directed RNA polymerase specialized sigma24 family protein